MQKVVMSNEAETNGGEGDDGNKTKQRVYDGLKRIELSSGRELFFIDAHKVNKNLSDRGFNNDVQLKNIAHSDLTSGLYEGGLKVWEGSIDLCNYIDSTPDEVVFINKSVLEIGCGSALPAILALQKGAKEAVVQDFNKAVIECFAKDNFAPNNVKIDKCQFLASNWTDLKASLNGRKFDVILTSETIYNERMYEQLHSVFDEALEVDGMILLAAKMYYFGVGGNIPTFLEFVKSQRKFDSFDVSTIDAEVPRKVIRFTRKV